MAKILLIVIGMFLLNCNTQKKVNNTDDTEHLWIGDNGIEFYE